MVTNIHGRVKFNLVESEIRLADKRVGPYLLISPVNNGAVRCFTDSL